MKEKLLKFYPGSASAKACIEAVDAELRKKGVYSDMALVGCIATVRVECGKSFLPLSENLNYNAASLMKMWPRYFPNPDIALEYARKPERIANRAYSNRMANGDEASGDGWRYRGRGWIQITGKANYIQYGLIDNPDSAMTVENSARVLVQYFIDRKCIEACNAKDWARVRKLVNGGHHGLELFKQVIEQYLK